MHSFPVLFDKMAVFKSWDLFNEFHWKRELPYVWMKKTPLSSKPTSFSGQNKRKNDIVKVSVLLAQKDFFVSKYQLPNFDPKLFRYIV